MLHSESALSGHPVIGALEDCHCIRLRALLSFDYIELDLIAFFERFVPVPLNRRKVDEYVRPIFASDESVTLGVLKPLNNSFVLCHKLLPSLPGISILCSGCINIRRVAPQKILDEFLPADGRAVFLPQ
jgi:hypothetical protein